MYLPSFIINSHLLRFKQSFGKCHVEHYCNHKTNYNNILVSFLVSFQKHLMEGIHNYSAAA